jgi:very-short-patch-repair endonuclease
MAAVLAGGSGAVLSHRSAGQLWRVAQGPATVELTRTSGSRPRPGLRLHRCPLPVDEVDEVDGIPVTSVARTLLDLAALAALRQGFTLEQLERALNESEVRRLTSRVSVPDLLRRYPGRRGAALLRSLLSEEDQAAGVTREELERRFAVLIDSRRLPRPRRNADVSVAGRFFEVDCLWPAQRLIVELDGHAVHGTRRAFEADRERDRLLVGDGWRVVRITWRQLRDDGPAIADELRAMLPTPTLKA